MHSRFPPFNQQNERLNERSLVSIRQVRSVDSKKKEQGKYLARPAYRFPNPTTFNISGSFLLPPTPLSDYLFLIYQSLSDISTSPYNPTTSCRQINSHLHLRSPKFESNEISHLIMEDSQLPSPAGTQLLVDVRGAEIVSSNSEDPEVYLPHHEEMISHIALDVTTQLSIQHAISRADVIPRTQIGGSLAKVVYFTRAPPSTSSKPAVSPSPFVDSPSNPSSPEPQTSTTNPFTTKRRTPSPPSTEPAKPNGILGPRSLSQKHITRVSSSSPSASHRGSAYPPFQSHLRRRSSASRIPPGGRLNFIKFETSKLTALINFLQALIESSAASNRVPVEVMKRNVKIMATGGGAHKFYERLKRELGVEVRREEEMECLVLGLGFVMEVPNEVFWYSDELVQAISHPQQRALSSVNVPSTPGRSATPLPIPPPSPPPSSEILFPPSMFDSISSTTSSQSTKLSSSPTPPPSTTTTTTSEELPRPSPNPPQYSISFDSNPTPAQFPCLLVNIGSGVSIIKIDDYGKFERISGTSLGGGTLWGLLSLLTGSKSFDGTFLVSLLFEMTKKTLTNRHMITQIC